MSIARTDDGVDLYYEEAGRGLPIIFVHEFAGDHRSWEPQLSHFARRYRCVTFAARGFPPSSVPTDPGSYSQARAVEDIATIVRAIGAEAAYVVGNSMGGFAALHFALTHPEMTLAAVVAGCGYGAHPDNAETFRSESEKVAVAFETEGSRAMSSWYGFGPARVQFEDKDPRGHREHVEILAQHDPIGAALTMRGVQKARPSLYSMTAELEACEPAVLIVAGDEDNGVLEADLMLKRTIPRSGLTVLPRTGHVSNLEEPALFNAVIEAFFHSVEADRWGPRDPRSLSSSVTGAK
ncbi:alpha/beta hydrolase [Aeromicrobium phragmitis]|uniref:Alpha/beta hydrolase n=1 Tax=Aeromicrobium phragmitis TaxID=2478914 RepID=A0A3L8PPS0_9ACTN|nr:alpha/beta hydrolase [Aeromicrobium phragmitis]RLV57361.1 alpha/beta hydrolase [Aeromicrobium phragmitis]